MRTWLGVPTLERLREVWRWIPELGGCLDLSKVEARIDQMPEMSDAQRYLGVGLIKFAPELREVHAAFVAAIMGSAGTPTELAESWLLPIAEEAAEDSDLEASDREPLRSRRERAAAARRRRRSRRARTRRPAAARDARRRAALSRLYERIAARGRPSARRRHRADPSLDVSSPSASWSASRRNASRSNGSSTRTLATNAPRVPQNRMWQRRCTSARGPSCGC